VQHFDAVVIGAGAAGLFCAGVAGQLGLRILVIDHSDKIAEKIRISGGGRCNFTNTDVTAQQFLSDNPRFARSALSRYGPRDFIALVHRHAIPFHEKHKGQLFCDRSAEDIIQMLLAECTAGAVTHWQPSKVAGIRSRAESDRGYPSSRFEIDTDRGSVGCKAVVIATGGLSIPKVGATDFGYRVAKQFDIPLVATRPALVPLTFEESEWAAFSGLSGLSLPVKIATGEKKNSVQFSEDMLFTHRGLSGPGVLQISSYWQEGTPIRLNLVPGIALQEHLLEAKSQSKKLIANTLAALVPFRLAELWANRGQSLGHDWTRAINEASDKSLAALASHLSDWALTPTGTEGYRKAEVTAGGVDTRVLSSQTMESRHRGLYFIGEVVDVTGWLGGYNFQWAWSSGYACAQGLNASLKRL